MGFCSICKQSGHRTQEVELHRNVAASGQSPSHWPRAKQLRVNGHPTGLAPPHPPEARARLPAAPAPCPASCPWSRAAYTRPSLKPGSMPSHPLIAHHSAVPGPELPSNPELTPTATPEPTLSPPSQYQPPHAACHLPPHPALNRQGSSVPPLCMSTEDWASSLVRKAVQDSVHGRAPELAGRGAQRGQVTPPGSHSKRLLSPGSLAFPLPTVSSPTIPGHASAASFQSHKNQNAWVTARGQERVRRRAVRKWGERRAEGSSVSPATKASQRPFEASLLPHPPNKEEGGGMGVGGVPRTGVPGQARRWLGARRTKAMKLTEWSPRGAREALSGTGQVGRGGRTAGSSPGSAPGSLRDQGVCPPFLNSVSLPCKYPSPRKQDFLPWKGLESLAYERDIKN